jgi:hypothetical protein
MKENPQSASAKQPLSAAKYAVIAAVGLAVAISFTFFYIRLAPSLNSSGDQDRVFYLLLIPWALSCAAFLFGAMRGYARLTHKRLGSSLELGGPVVLFCLVLVGGFKLVPSSLDTFDIAVRASGPDKPLITSGEIVLDVGGSLQHQRIGPDGEATFRGISARMKGASVRVLPQVEGYEQAWVPEKLEGATINLALTATHPTIVLTGSIIPPSIQGTTIRIVVDGQQDEAEPDSYGRFRISVSGKPGDAVRLKVFCNGALAKMDDYVLPGPVTIVLDNATASRPVHPKP